MAKRTKLPSPEARPVFDPAAIDALIGETKTQQELEGLFWAMKQADVVRRTEAAPRLRAGETKPAGQVNDRDGSTPRTVFTENGTLHLAVPRDRAGSFDPQLVPKDARRLPGFDAKVISAQQGRVPHLAILFGERFTQVTDSPTHRASHTEIRTLPLAREQVLRFAQDDSTAARPASSPMFATRQRHRYLGCMIRRAIVLLMFSTTAGAAQGTPPRAAATPTYQPGIDVLDYAVTLELPDSGAFLRGDVTVAVRRASGVTHLRLDLADQLTVRTVEVGGRSVNATHSGEKIDVPLDGAADSLKVRVVYDGTVTDGLVVRRDDKGRWTWFGDNWPDRARQWLPTVDHPSDKATVSWTVVAPVGRTVVANGALLSTRRVARAGREMTETRWRESRPIATYLMVIAAGPLELFDLREPDCHIGDQGQCVRQSVYVLPDVKGWLPGPFAAAGPIVSLFERLVGPFPYEKLAHLQSSTRFGGMENASAIFYDDKLFASRTLMDGLIAHETAHQWFGDAVTEREWAHLWLSEGFATYFAALWTQSARGDAAYRAEMAQIRDQVLADGGVAVRPVLDTAETRYLSLLNANSYQKGGYILYMLHRQLGDSAFFGGLRSYYATYRHGTALSADLQHELERSSHVSLAQFFDQWLRRPGVAAPAIGWAYDAATSAISIRVVQDDARGAYELSLPVTIVDASGRSTQEMVRVPAETQATISLAGRYAMRPRSLAFDPDALLLARITRL